MRVLRLFAAGCISLLGLSVAAQVPTPESVLGHKIGDDFYLATYEDAVKYFHAAAAASDRMKMFSIGKSTQGREFEVGVISSPKNLARLEEFKKDGRQLATAETLSGALLAEAQAHKLAHDTPAIVHIDGGLHSSEVAGGQHSVALAYKLLSAKNDPEIDAILDNDILILWPTLNPDGQDMIVNWYRQNVGTRFEVAPLPWLYQEYVGHDNNRDGFMLNMKEEQVVVKAELEYSPVIFYCQHQTAPFPARIWIPPFADPISSNVSPYVRSWLNLIGTNMAAYLDAHHMPGAIHETQFDNWYAGFTDWAGVFRGEISFFTETALYRYATPRFYTVDEFPQAYRDLRPGAMYTTPWLGGWWRLKDAVDTMVTASMSVLDIAAKNREALNYNRYQTAFENIKRTEPPFAYVIPSKQADVPTAGILAGKMIENGLDVYESKAGFHANGVEYPAGSWVIPMDQPFSPMAKELMERQVYPASATSETASGAHQPYDITGWTLPLQMGVVVDTVSDPMTPEERGKLTKIAAVKLPPADVSGEGTHFAVSHKPNASFKLVNAVLAKGGTVEISTDSVKTPEGMERGAFIIGGVSRGDVDGMAKKYGVGAVGLSDPGKGIALKKARVGLYRPWTGSIDEGWTRWVLENFDYEPKSIYNADMRSANLRSRYDVIVIPDMSGRQMMNGFGEGVVPGQYAGGIERSGLANLQEFVEQGGTLVAFNQAASGLIPLMSLPVKNILEGVPGDKFFCAGALLRVQVTHPELPVNFSVPSSPVVMFERGPAFETLPGFKGAILARYPKEEDSLESGMILHQEMLRDKAAAVEVSFGKGHILLYGFKPQHRGQAHGTYRYLFNTLYQYDEAPMPNDPITGGGSGPAAPAATPAPGAGAGRRAGGTP